MRDYQPTFDDLQRADELISLPGRTAFIDESGSFSRVSENDSRYYIVCSIVVENKNTSELEHQVKTIAMKNDFKTNEMKSSVIGSNQKRRFNILRCLLDLDFKVMFLVVDKKRLKEESPLKEYKDSFIKFIHQKMYYSMYHLFPKLRIVEDEHGRVEFQNGYKEYVERHRPEPNLFNSYEFTFVNSKDVACVQIADVLAGSLRRNLEGLGETNVRTLFSSKIVSYELFPDNDVNCFYKVKTGSREQDKQILAIAYKLATDFIDDNIESEEEDIRLQVLFLEQLKYNINSGRDSFIYSNEIVDYLSFLAGKNVKKEYLYRRIVAPLRDKGLIVASCSNGYKLPTSIEDVSKYVHQTTSVVGPMLNRIKICRDTIKQMSDSTFDILDDLALSGYRRFFGEY